jgi:hypothetical protein
MFFGSSTIQDLFCHLLAAEHHIHYPATAFTLRSDEPQTLYRRFVRRWLVANHRRYTTE